MSIAPSRGGKRVLSADEILAFIQQHVRITEDGCHVWAGTSAGRRTPVLIWNKRRFNARRLMLDLSGRVLTDRQVLFGTCGTLCCMRMDHLRVGTRAQMIRSMAVRGQVRSGPTHAIAVAAGRAANARLPMCERMNVARMRADGWVWSRIAEHYKVHPSLPQKAMHEWQRVFGPAAMWAHGERRAA